MANAPQAWAVKGTPGRGLESEIGGTQSRMNIPSASREKPWRLVLTGTVLLLWLSGTGCAGDAISRRMVERSAAFRQASKSMQESAKSGRIRRGMETNLVYIALGQPGEVLSTPGGTSWIYYDVYSRESRDRTLWVGTSPPSGGAYSTMEERRRSVAGRYLCLQIDFEGGRVVRWYENAKPLR